MCGKTSINCHASRNGLRTCRIASKKHGGTIACIDEQVHLVALAWVGRGTFSADEFDEAVEIARHERVNTTSRYLLGMPLLADYLEAGLELLGISVEDAQRGVP